MCQSGVCVCVCVCVCVQLLSPVWLFVTPWTVASQAPLSRGFPRLESWSGLPFPRPGDLPDPGIEAASPALAGKFFTANVPPGKPLVSSISFEMIRPSALSPPLANW